MHAAAPRPRLVWAAVAASILCAIAVWQFRARPAAVTGWQIASIEGSAQAGGSQGRRRYVPARPARPSAPAGDSQLTLRADDLGSIDLFPDSEIRASTTRQVKLNRGKLHAFIWARPGQFVVDTPSSRAIDLGCEYTINVDPAGDGLLQGRHGLGGISIRRARELHPRRGAVRHPQAYRARAFRTMKIPPRRCSRPWDGFERGDRGSLPVILAEARPRDGLTLWHLLTRVPRPKNESAVFDRFAQLVAVPAGRTKEAVLRRDTAAIDRCWDALNLENTDWWRGWERKW